MQKTQGPPPGGRGLSEGIFASAGQRSGSGGRGNGEGVVCSCWRATTVSHASYDEGRGRCKQGGRDSEGPFKSSPRFTTTTSTIPFIRPLFVFGWVAVAISAINQSPYSLQLFTAHYTAPYYNSCYSSAVIASQYYLVLCDSSEQTGPTPHPAP